MKEIIYNILRVENSITDIVNDRIYPVNAPQSAPMPYIIVETSEVIPHPAKDSAGRIDEYAIDITCFGSKYDEIHTLQKNIKSILNRYRNSDVDFAYYEGQEDEYDKTANVFIIIAEYKIRRIL